MSWHIKFPIVVEPLFETPAFHSEYPSFAGNWKSVCSGHFCIKGDRQHDLTTQIHKLTSSGTSVDNDLSMNSINQWNCWVCKVSCFIAGQLPLKETFLCTQCLLQSNILLIYTKHHSHQKALWPAKKWGMSSNRSALFRISVHVSIYQYSMCNSKAYDTQFSIRNVMIRGIPRSNNSCTTKMLL